MDKKTIKVGSVNGTVKFPKIKVSRAEGKLSPEDLDHFRALLIEKRREILGDVGSMETEAFKNQDNHSNSPMHMADVGTDNFEQEFTLGLIESERQLLREIQEALGRIEEGTYGICVSTGKPIGKARLEATPWAKHCIEYARMLEQGLVGRESQSDNEEEESSSDDEDE
ncbi:MAG TPA: TraR/DksA family transcriptional regulator [Phycisphaerae bacterium]|nr:TraR/DksA family transcriptional regulator [Phycisphaerae bacterium]